MTTTTTSPAPPSGIRELDHRHADGIDVRLLWNPSDNRVHVCVTDERTGESLRVYVSAGETREAFYHPYAYAYAADARGRTAARNGRPMSLVDDHRLTC